MDAADRPLLSTRSRKQMSELSPISLSSAHIAQAIQRSSDGGATLMFSKNNLADIPVVAVEELTRLGRAENESLLQRITLGYNHISTLPTVFAQLSHLRYLNLKHNNFSVFPEVLTLLPSLDTLDFSHNKVKQLPIQPGYLIHLRVLQVDRNPIAWPPKFVIEKSENLDSSHAMKDWIQSLQLWLEGNSQMHNDTGHGQGHDLDTYMEERRNKWRFPPSESISDDFIHNRSLSVDSSFSTSSASESLREAEIPNSIGQDADRPPPLHLGILGTFSAENSPTRALGESYLPSPADSEFFDDSPKLSPVLVEHQPHVRNVSYSSGLKPSMNSSLAGKKSMPDLRSARLRFNTNPPAPLNVGTSHPMAAQNSHLSVSAIPRRQNSDSSLSSNRATAITQEANEGSPTRTMSSMTFERNSYFQRLSTLPTSTILPQPLLCLIESARSILFAMCQVYQTLEHLIAHAMDDRISSVLRKVLDPASTDMTQLINSLERFDTSSRKTLPPPAVCRGVLESCRDTVALFGKAVGVLALQLQVIVTGDDARHSRWILLELYGATAEVASVWETMAPQIDAIRPFLHTKSFAAQAPSLAPNSLLAELYSSSPTPTASRTADPPLSSLRSQNSAPGVALNGGVRTARRHAGSFSFKDVEIGKQLPSYEDAPGLFGGVISGTARPTPTLRAPKRQATIPITTISSPSPTALASTSTASLSATIGDSSQAVHSRQGSQASLQTSASSSPSIPTRPTFLELPSSSKTQIDKEALHAVQAAVDVAPSVWDMIENLFDEPSSSVLETMKKARSVTARLSDTLQAMHDIDTLSDKKDLRDDAHAFLKFVVQLSNVIRTYKGPRSVSSALRTGMVKLTNSTEEFAILLHVSSFSPSTPRPYTPILANAIGPEELRLGSSLSRSKSAQHAGSFKFRSIAHDGPRSALPTQTFKLPAVRPLRSRDGLDGPNADPR
ncbi:hypothetical protein H0H92_013421 [Tricholoma furcatifolium]|nr:hypothetical protein H0H92_013421 [Tricholoma furcatifolium]